MVREKKSMIGFDPLAWLNDDEKPKTDDMVQETTSSEPKKTDKSSAKITKSIVTVLGHKLDENALLKGYELASDVMDEVVTNFYNELFTQYPALVPLFKNTTENARAMKLGAAIKLLVDYIHNEDILKITLTDMGSRHQAYGALPDHYPVVAELLVASFKKTIGRSWTKAISAAWMEMLSLAAETMCAGYQHEVADEMPAEMETAVMSDENKLENNITENALQDESSRPVLHLNCIQDISKSQALKNDILILINDNDEIDIDAEEVERIDGSALQLLCALFSYAAQNNLEINWLKPSAALLSAASTLGMQKILELG